MTTLINTDINPLNIDLKLLYHFSNTNMISKCKFRISSTANILLDRRSNLILDKQKR